MRKLILEEWMSLDGFVEDANGQLDFFTAVSEDNRYADLDQLKFLDTVDTILLGRKTYEVFVDYWPVATTDKEVIADKLNATSKIVFSNTLTTAPWGKWPAAEVQPGDAIENIRRLKLLPGKDLVMWGSISLAKELMKENLVDEYHIQLCPVSVGGGRPLFPTGRGTSKLDLIEAKPYPTGNVLLKYVPKK